MYNLNCNARGSSFRISRVIGPTLVRACILYFISKILNFSFTIRDEEGQPQKFLVRATFSLFSRPSRLIIFKNEENVAWKINTFKTQVYQNLNWREKRKGLSLISANRNIFINGGLLSVGHNNKMAALTLSWSKISSCSRPFFALSINFKNSSFKVSHPTWSC